MNQNARSWAIACLAVLGTTLPLAAESASRSRAGPSEHRNGRFPFGSTLTLGLVGGYTLTPDYRTGFLGIGNLGSVKDDGSPELGLPPLEAHNVLEATYLRPSPSFPLLGVFAETELTARVSLQASVLIRELAEAEDTVWSEPSQRRFSESEGRFYYADFDRSNLKGIDVWEIPVMVKYRFGILEGKAARVRPFLGAGPAFWVEKNRRPNAPRVRDPHHGIVAGIGFDVQWQGWSLSPQASYTRWATDADPRLSKNQVQITIGFSF
ncbi:MAG: hypothetical protein F4Y47_02755 [Acidobacteriia bacterium]|nr:hypothetical protein [Terriglobia bacterium]MYK12072.1 hypothetical protein [Terriglobia bacterium]